MHNIHNLCIIFKPPYTRTTHATPQTPKYTHIRPIYTTLIHSTLATPFPIPKTPNPKTLTIPTQNHTISAYFPDIPHFIHSIQYTFTLYNPLCIFIFNQLLCNPNIYIMYTPFFPPFRCPSVPLSVRHYTRQPQTTTEATETPL